MLSHATLKARQRAERDRHAEGIALRIHRALSWLQRSEQCDDEDGRFIFLWIAFNAAYANDLGEMRMAESRLLGEFLQRLSQLDRHDRLYELVWRRYPGAIRLLLDNRYVFQPYWDQQNGLAGSDGLGGTLRRGQAGGGRCPAHSSPSTFRRSSVLIEWA
jgi:hypothetical protein